MAITIIANPVQGQSYYQSIAHIAAALAISITTTWFVTPLAENWGADYAVYVASIENTDEFLRRLILLSAQDALGIISLLPHVVFFAIPFIGQGFGINAPTILAILSTFSAFVTALYVLKNSRSKTCLVFLFNPFLFDLVYFQVRNGLALALLMVGLLLLQAEHKKTAYPVFLLSVLMHYAIALFFIIWIAIYLSRHWGVGNKRLANSVIVHTVLGISIAILFVVGNSLVNRDYVRESAFHDASVTGLLFFVVLVLLYIVGGLSFIKRFRLQFLFSIVLLALYPFFAGTLRLLSLVLPFHLCAFSHARLKITPYLFLFVLTLSAWLNWQPVKYYLGG